MGVGNGDTPQVRLLEDILVEMRNGFGGLRAEVGGLRAEVAELRGEVRTTNLRLDNLIEIAAPRHHDHEERLRDLEERIRKLEGR
jgi:hypothetical protein